MNESHALYGVVGGELGSVSYPTTAVGRDRDKSQLDQAMDGLHMRIELLTKAVVEVEQRFAPVCRPEPPQPSNPNVGTPEAVASPLTHSIRACAGKLNVVEARLRGLLDRAEV